MVTLRAIFLLSILVILPWTELEAATPAPAPASDAANPPAASAGTPTAPAAAAPDEKLPSVPTPEFPAEQSKLDDWKATLDRTETVLRSRSIPDNTLSYMRDRAAEVQGGSRDLIATVTPALNTATARAAELAPDPKSATPQSDSVKLERAKLQAEVAARQSVIQQAKLLTVRAQQALDAISEHRRAVFADSVLRRSDSLLSPSFWATVAAGLPPATGRLIDLVANWAGLLASQPLRAASGLLIVAIVLVGFFVSPWRRWQARWTAREAGVNPSPLRKSGSAAAIVLAGTAIPGVALLVLYQSLIALGVLPRGLDLIVRAMFLGITFASFFVSLTKAVLAPGRPSWRLIGSADAAADGMVPVAVTIGLAIVLGMTLDATNRAVFSPPELTLASQGVVAIVIALLFMAALRAVAKVETDDEADEATAAKRSAWRLLIPVGWAVAVAAVIAPLGGYVAFGRFASSELVVVAAVLMSFFLLSQFADAVIAATFAFHGWAGRLLRQMTGLRNGSVRQIAAVLHGLVQVVLVALAAFVVLARWGINTDDIFDTMSAAFFSFTIGQFNISLSAIFGALVVLLIGVLATRTIQQWLEARFLPATNLDVGVRSSIRTGVGYLGVIVAAIIALSYVGLNLQNIAIVAGALSVGIGFGLQSIINNFVSGIILLVERPIKVGDRIEVGARMGVVKRINVRATEIVTYDNLSVIVPNAELISGQVVNWMHGSFSARLSVTVGAAYDSDPDRVIAILLEIAAANERALKVPEPFAILSNFGADALEFMVFFHVANIGVDAGAANEVRLEILKRFRKEAIEIPFAQRDIHLRDLDRIEALIRQAASTPRKRTKDASDPEAAIKRHAGKG
jgi:potassium-dependent mechanosensitive channel